MRKLEGKVAIITGAGSGMGKAISLAFSKAGASILAADISSGSLYELKNEIEQTGGKVSTLTVDMACGEDIEKMITGALTIYGTLDILVNNAGIMDQFAPVLDTDDELWERVMSINIDGPFKAMRSALGHFLKKKKGNIINIASLGGLNGARAGAAYTASKHALVGLTKNTGYIYAKDGIRCNAIAPGGVKTNIGLSVDYSKMNTIVKERVLPGLALSPRIGAPSEIAEVALFLASEDSSFINGAVLVADGGWDAF